MWLPGGCRGTEAESRTNRPHSKGEEILVAQLRNLPHLDFLRDEGRSELLTFMCTEEISNVAVVVGGDHPPELRAPRRSRRASMIIVIEFIMMTEG